MEFSNEIFLPTTSQKATDLLSKFKERLKKSGLQLVNIPTIELTPIKKWDQIQSTLANLHKIDIMIFTSQYAVEFFFQHLKKLKREYDFTAKIWLVIGEKTAKKLQKEFPLARNILLPKIATTTSMLELMIQKKIQTKHYWFVCSQLTNHKIKTFITSQGGSCVQNIIYNNHFPSQSEPLIQAYFQKKIPLWAVFTSPSSFRNLANILKDKISIFQKIKIAVLGETTSLFIQKNQLPIKLIATKSLEQIFDIIVTQEKHLYA